MLEVNLGGVLNLARAASRRCCAAGRAAVRAGSSRSLRPPPPGDCRCWPRTAPPRQGSTGLVRALAAELAGTGLTANAVSPGSTDTPILAESARLYGLPGADAFAAQQPVRRLLEPGEIASVLAFLAGPASSAMTGAVVPVDGGLAL